MKKHTEIRFEEAIEKHLLEHGCIRLKPEEYDAERTLFPKEVIEFIKSTQQKEWEYICEYNGSRAEEVILEALEKELDTKGSLFVLRHGFRCFGKNLQLAFFKPNTGFNPEAQRVYDLNRYGICRQVHYSVSQKGLSIDIVLTLNGVPVCTLELKNPLSGQTVENAKHQYRYDRDPREKIFQFKKRTLVHFAVDTEQAFMTTMPKGKETRFLPFNKGFENGAGNPPVEDNYRTAYLWEEVLEKDSLIDIIGRFLHLETKEIKVETKKGFIEQKKETLIFPRYHQLDSVRKLITNARAKGAGRNYLVQHSAGSGKSNSIAWLAYRLSTLHNAENEKIFNSVIVITDRKVLDKQLQDTIYQFEHKEGVVEKIDQDTRQLVMALSTNVPIIITTLQKFPFVSETLEKLTEEGEQVSIKTGGKRFAVIVDEAHSSQSGEASAELRKVLNKEGIEAVVAAEILGTEEEELSEDAKEELIREMAKRRKQPNLSFFAFTATPKFKTIVMFNEPGPQGTSPFHLYSMRQAIEEGFILDVLANYTTYKRYYKLIKKVEDDPNVPKRKTARELNRFVELHPHNLNQKVEIIVEHFRYNTKMQIGGSAKAMIVTGSRLHAVRYKQAFDKYIREKGYGDVKALVAFSGTVEDPDIPSKTYTEPAMNNGIRESELPDKFGTGEYQVLIVAEKYQTGFDQPLLHTMYVDKRLAGVQAVQTLSRLNRTAPGKESTFILDFVNDRDEIFEAFKPYYEVTEYDDLPDPHQLYTMEHKILEARIFSQQDVDDFCNIWFSTKKDLRKSEHKKLNAILDPAVEKFKQLSEEEGEALKKLFVQYKNLYSFLSQIIPYGDSRLEKLFVFLRNLIKKLPRRESGSGYELGDDVALHYYRLSKIAEGAINLKVGENPVIYGPSEVGTGGADEEVELSTLIERLNERFGTDFTPADQLFFDQITESAVENEDLKEAAQANTYDNFFLVINKLMESLFVERMEGNEEIFTKIMNDEEFRELTVSHLSKQIYDRLTESGQ